MADLKVPLITPLFDTTGKVSKPWFDFLNSLIAQGADYDPFSDPGVDVTARAQLRALDAANAFDESTPIADPSNLARLNLPNTFQGPLLLNGAVEMESTLALGAPYNATGTTPAPVQLTGNVQITGTLTVSGTVTGAAGATPASLNVTTSYKVGGVKVIGAQQSAIATPSNTAVGTAGATYGSTTQTLINALVTTVASQQTAINALRTALQTHGLTL